MRIGVAYNLFDGAELLEVSIRCIRDYVDYICINYQQVSNWGNPDRNDTVSILKELKTKKLIDDVFLYTPMLKAGGHVNEIHKRQLGLEQCIIAGCDYHMSMDCDEYYKPEEFKFALDCLKDSDYDGAACKMVTYYHDKDCQILPPEEYYVSFIFKVNDGDQFRIAAPYPVIVDPTRRILGKTNIKIFEREEIQMHHMSYVRKDLESFKDKLRNSSASVNFSKEGYNEVVTHYANWEYPMTAKTIGMAVSEFITRKVDNSWIK